MVSAVGSLFFLLLLRDPHNILDVECDGGVDGEGKTWYWQAEWICWSETWCKRRPGGWEEMQLLANLLTGRRIYLNNMYMIFFFFKKDSKHN